MKQRHYIISIICIAFLVFAMKPEMRVAAEATEKEVIKEITKEETAEKEAAKEEIAKEDTSKEEASKEEDGEKAAAKKAGTKKAEEEVTITISAAGDCTLSSDIKQPVALNFFSVLQKQKSYDYFFQNVKPIFEKDDLTIVNFEGTLSNRGSRANKQWAFRGKPAYINILTKGSVEAVAFANNHVRDYGEISYTDTIECFEKAGIVYSSDTKLGFYETKGIKIGMISIQETSRSDAASVLRKALKAMKKKKPDLLIVSFHWGIEKTSKITQSQKDLSRIAIDEGGADLVLGHHPHVLQPIEKYKDAFIVYSLGNFCFGGNTNPPDKDTMIFQQTFTFRNHQLVKDDNIQIIPCSVSSVTNKNNYQPTPSSGNEKIRILKKLNSYCKQFGIRFNRNGRLY
jgi:poly-gamma-glutamate capsule biosynthesis protein CapA/YwtB (metallophosphatase superfamily)